MPREVTWIERTDKPPDVAPLADPSERVILRVPIGKRPEVPRATIPRLGPPAPPSPARPVEDQGEVSDVLAGAGEATAQVGRPDEAEATQPKGDDREEDAHEGEAEERPIWPPPREELEELVRAGLSNQEIADRYGVPRATVAWRLSRLGIRRDRLQRSLLRSRAGRKAAAVMRQLDAEPAPAEVAAQGVPGGLDPIDTFCAALAQAIRQARAMGLDVEVRLRVEKERAS